MNFELDQTDIDRLREFIQSSAFVETMNKNCVTLVGMAIAIETLYKKCDELETELNAE